MNPTNPPPWANDFADIIDIETWEDVGNEHDAYRERWQGADTWDAGVVVRDAGTYWWIEWEAGDARVEVCTVCGDDLAPIIRRAWRAAYLANDDTPPGEEVPRG